MNTSNMNSAKVAGASTIPSPAAFRYQQQRTSSNVGSGSSSSNSSTINSATTTTSKTTTTTITLSTFVNPKMKRTNSSLAATLGTTYKEDSNSRNTSTTPSATTAVSSFTTNMTSSSTSSSSSLQYYSNLIQHQMYNLRKSRNKVKKSKHSTTDATNIWTVQMPKRMLLGTMGIFLLIPVLIFVYKEMHLPSMDEQLLRGNHYGDHSSSNGKLLIKNANRNQEYVTWMASFLTNEEVEEEEEEEGDEVLDSAEVHVIRDINETSKHTIDNYDRNRNNGTTMDVNDLLILNEEEANQGITNHIHGDLEEEETDELED